MIKNIYICTESDFVKNNFESAFTKDGKFEVKKISISDYLHNTKEFDVVHYYTSALESLGVIPDIKSEIISTGNKNGLCSYIVTSPTLVDKELTEREFLLKQIEMPLKKVNDFSKGNSKPITYAMHYDIFAQKNEKGEIEDISDVIFEVIKGFEY